MRYIKIKNQILHSLPKKRSSEVVTHDFSGLKNASLAALAIVGLAGFVSISLVAPNLFSVLGKIGKFKSKHRNQSDLVEQTNHVFYYLRKKGYVTFKGNNAGNIWVRLTGKGKKMHEKLSLQSLKIPKPKKWDGKWWQIAADIPTQQYRRAADLFRLKVKQLHLYPLQRSLWFYPFDPRDEIEYITKYFHIEKFVTVMEINRLDTEDEKVLKQHFKKFHIL